MFLFKSYVELMVLVSIFPSSVPHIRNLSPLIGRINTDLPDALKTTANLFEDLGIGDRFSSGFSEAAFSIDAAASINAEELEDALKEAFAQSSNLQKKGGLAAVSAPKTPTGAAVGSAEEAASVPDFSDLFQDLCPAPPVASNGPPRPRLEGISLSLYSFRQTQPSAEKDSNCIGKPVEIASILLKKRKKWTGGEALEYLTNLKLDEESCLKQQQRPNCTNKFSKCSGVLCNPNDPYRRLDGCCNNLHIPEWGAADRPFNRYLQPAYEDGIHEMRGENRVNDLSLPSARTVSVGLQGISQVDPREDLTLMVMQWGQFLDHDLTHTPEQPEGDDDNDETSAMECCEYGQPKFPLDDDCRPIFVGNDPLHSKLGRCCMHFVRSLTASKGCSTGSLGPREQLNQVTSYLDSSNVYGSEDEEAEDLRTGFSGLLRESTRRVESTMMFGHSGTFLPRAGCMEAMNNEQNCFQAGDVRVNEQPLLTSMHTLWLRVHNNIVRDLASINPSWDDEMIYQETRRIVSALNQQITYREFLPIVLGPKIMREFQLNLRDKGYDNSYDSSVDATVVNVFATAAFRFGHTLIPEIFKGMGNNVTLRGNFDEPRVLEDPSTGPSALLQGLTTCPTRGSDAFLTPTLVNQLLSEKSAIGLDLMSLNIQRGRDHGLPPYHEWRRSCNLSQINSFEDLFSIMDPQVASLFAETYKSVEDIDLFPAALAENTTVGGLLGPTFSILIAQQFQALKFGDRFWYENMNQPNPFTTDQLSALREQSLSSIMCQHLGLRSLQPLAFRSDHLQGNYLQDCSTFPRLDLGLWSRDPIPPPITTTRQPYHITTPNPMPKDPTTTPIQPYHITTPNPMPKDPNSIPNDRYNKRPWFPCITPLTPKSHLNYFYPMCTSDLFKGELLKTT